MTRDSSTRGGCVDDLDLQAMADGELDGARLELAHLHLTACADCGARLHAIREQALRIQEVLGGEDELRAEDTLESVSRVEAACARARATVRRTGAGWFVRRFGLGLIAAAAVLLVAVWQAGNADLTAAPGRILDEAMLRERAWMYRPGKVLQWVVEEEISGSSRLPDGRYRSRHWISSVKGAEGSLLRRTDASGALVSAVWRRSDGSVVSYLRSRPEPLRIEPSTAELRAQLGGMSQAEAQALRSFLESRAQEAEVGIQGSRFARWFLDAANSRGDVRAERIRTPDGRDGYYLRVERGPGAVIDRSVVRMVIETYIEGEGYRRYRQRSQRDLSDGRQWVEDARWSEFGETDLRTFEANALNDLLASMPAVKVTPRELAQRRLGASAAGSGARGTSTR